MKRIQEFLDKRNMTKGLKKKETEMKKYVEESNMKGNNYYARLKDYYNDDYINNINKINNYINTNKFEDIADLYEKDSNITTSYDNKEITNLHKNMNKIKDKYLSILDDSKLSNFGNIILLFEFNLKEDDVLEFTRDISKYSITTIVTANYVLIEFTYNKLKEAYLSMRYNIIQNLLLKELHIAMESILFNNTFYYTGKCNNEQIIIENPYIDILIINNKERLNQYNEYIMDSRLENDLTNLYLVVKNNIVYTLMNLKYISIYNKNLNKDTRFIIQTSLTAINNYIKIVENDRDVNNYIKENINIIKSSISIKEESRDYNQIREYSEDDFIEELDEIIE